jgi:hypothetical protein
LQYESVIDDFSEPQPKENQLAGVLIRWEAKTATGLSLANEAGRDTSGSCNNKATDFRPTDFRPSPRAEFIVPRWLHVPEPDDEKIK